MIIYVHYLRSQDTMCLNRHIFLHNNIIADNGFSNCDIIFNVDIIPNIHIIKNDSIPWQKRERDSKMYEVGSENMKSVETKLLQ